MEITLNKKAFQCARLPTVRALPTRCQHRIWTGGVGSQVNKFEQVSSDVPPDFATRGTEAWGAGGPMSDVQECWGVPCSMSRGPGVTWHCRGQPCTVRSNASWVIVGGGGDPIPRNRQAGSHLWKHYLPQLHVGRGGKYVRILVSIRVPGTATKSYSLVTICSSRCNVRIYPFRTFGWIRLICFQHLFHLTHFVRYVVLLVHRTEAWMVLWMETLLKTK